MIIEQECFDYGIFIFFIKADHYFFIGQKPIIFTLTIT
jgi:hypothetical protein